MPLFPIARLPNSRKVAGMPSTMNRLPYDKISRKQIVGVSQNVIDIFQPIFKKISPHKPPNFINSLLNRPTGMVRSMLPHRLHALQPNDIFETPFLEAAGYRKD
ncbi:unnamed protein product [Enterobius vermicularis]|uniref:DUF1015 domain-containing protein n=1 Tax=Enterobius vermicularis TaxID=51028 RepID=A0A0N4UWR6_ENTVE|nr:unnamed protein product [Enterobius vermicularis]